MGGADTKEKGGGRKHAYSTCNCYCDVFKVSGENENNLLQQQMNPYQKVVSRLAS